MKVSARLTYSPRPDTTPQAELDALANVYRFLVFGKCKEAAHPAAPDEAKGTNGRPAKEIVPE